MTTLECLKHFFFFFFYDYSSHQGKIVNRKMSEFLFFTFRNNYRDNNGHYINVCKWAIFPINLK
jgi:hypothetical protein